MSLKFNVDTKDLRALKKGLKKLSGSQKEEFLSNLNKEIAGQLLNRIIRRTPVDTGYLIKNWTGGMENVGGLEYVYGYLDSVKNGDTYTLYLNNPTKYAPYVEYGHRTINGGWVEGKFMCTKSISVMKRVYPKVARSVLEKYLKEGLNTNV